MSFPCTQMERATPIIDSVHSPSAEGEHDSKIHHTQKSTKAVKEWEQKKGWGSWEILLQFQMEHKKGHRTVNDTAYIFIAAVSVSGIVFNLVEFPSEILSIL